MAKRIYLDYASLTPIDPRVLREMKFFSSAKYANPSSLYREGVAAKKAIDDSRKKIADSIHAHPDEIVFTSGGTESNNTALLGAIEALREKGVEYKDMHVLVGAIEHSSVRECANYLSGKDVTIEIVAVEKSGLVSLKDLKKKIRPNTVIISIMTVNNEIGTIQPIREIAKVIRQARANNKGSIFDFQTFAYPLFHTDAAQAPLYMDLNVEQFGVDMLTLDAGKVYGPRGSGALYVRRESPVTNILYGGGQESGRRSGTENIPAITGFAKAIEIAIQERTEEVKRILSLKSQFLKGLKKIKADIHVNGSVDHMVPHILNVSIPRIDNELFALRLDAKGVAVSTKSSCLRDEEESYVLQSIGERSKNAIRFSFGRFTKKADITATLKIIAFLADFC